MLEILSWRSFPPKKCRSSHKLLLRASIRATVKGGRKLHVAGDDMNEPLELAMSSYAISGGMRTLGAAKLEFADEPKTEQIKIGKLLVGAEYVWCSAVPAEADARPLQRTRQAYWRREARTKLQQGTCRTFSGL